MKNIKEDSQGSIGLTIDNTHNDYKTYTKQVSSYLYKYVIDYINGLSNILNIPIMKYDFFRENYKNYIKTVSYDTKIDYDEIIIEPLYYDDIIDGIYMLKEYLLKYENGYDTYQSFLKQIVLALLINDSDRTIDNTKFYRKNNNIYIAPYFDIHMAMNLDADYPVLIDDYYLSKKEFDEENKEEPLRYEDAILYFDKNYNEYYNFIFNQYILGDHSNNEVWKILFEEIEDKKLFDKIEKLEFNDVIEVSKINKNAYKIIYEQFNIAKDIFNQSIHNKRLR